MKKVLLTSTVAVLFSIASCSKQTAEPAEQGLYFPQVKEIIQQNCLGCHTQGGQGMPVILTDDSDIVNYGASIKAATVDPASLGNKPMPPGIELSAADKTIISNWFELGGTESG